MRESTKRKYARAAKKEKRFKKNYAIVEAYREKHGVDFPNKNKRELELKDEDDNVQALSSGTKSKKAKRPKVKKIKIYSTKVEETFI